MSTVPVPEAFRAFTREDEPLAPLTWFRLGGPARRLARPRTAEELAELWRWCRAAGEPVRVLAGGSNLLVREEGVPDWVVQLESPAFSDVRVEESGIIAGAAVPLTALSSQAARAGLAGLEHFTGIPGTVGGALRVNSGARQGAIGAAVRRVTVLDQEGQVQTLERDDLDLTETGWNPEGCILLSVEFALQADDPEAVVRRMRRIWIIKKEHQPYGHQSSGYIFRSPSPEMPAEALIERAGMRGTRAGNVEVSERNANFIVAHPGASSQDVLRLIDHVRERVAKAFGIDLALHLQIW